MPRADRRSYTGSSCGVIAADPPKPAGPSAGFPYTSGDDREAREAAEMRTSLMVLAGMLLGASRLGAADAPPTFYKDVLPILQANCQSCHRPGEVAPMSLVTYEQTRPW